jgi:hypothetical protein
MIYNTLSKGLDAIDTCKLIPNYQPAHVLCLTGEKMSPR